MAAHHYHFITKWQLDASPEVVYRTLQKAERLPKWWSTVYLKVDIMKQGDATGVGKEVSLLTKGWLPYKLRWNFRVIDSHFPTGYSLEAWGDFIGKGTWTFRPLDNGQRCEATYDWKVSAEKPLLKYLSFLLYPIFSANHHWAMRQGEKCIKIELEKIANHKVFHS